MSEQPPTAPPPPPEHQRPVIPPILTPEQLAATKPPFEWKKFFLGAAILPALAILWVLANSAMAALSRATDGSVPSGLPVAPGLLGFGLAVVAGIVMLTQPRWRPVGAGLLSAAAVSAILLGAACIALIAMLSQGY